MESVRSVKLVGAGLLMFLSAFITPSYGAGLYTRTDTLPCGNVEVRAFTTCPEDAKDPSACTDQHFLFVNKTNGASIKMDRSGKSAARNVSGGNAAWIRGRGLAYSWACEESKSGFYVYVDAASARFSNWNELWDLRGRKLASTRGSSDKTWDRFYRVWNARYLPVHPLPVYDLVPIQLFKTDRTDDGNPWN
jgi:hypothetical protein